MREANFGLVSFLGDFERGVRAIPLILVFGEAESGIGHFPYHLFIGHQLQRFLFAVVDVLVAIDPFLSNFVRRFGNLLRLPATHIVDGCIGFGWRLLDNQRNFQILVFHCGYSSVSVWNAIVVFLFKAHPMIPEGLGFCLAQKCHQQIKV